MKHNMQGLTVVTIKTLFEMIVKNTVVKYDVRAGTTTTVTNLISHLFLPPFAAHLHSFRLFRETVK